MARLGMTIGFGEPGNALCKISFDPLPAFWMLGTLKASASRYGKARCVLFYLVFRFKRTPQTSTGQNIDHKEAEMKSMKKRDAEVSDLDVAELLDSEEVVKLYLEEALAANDPVLWQRCLGHAARSAGMAKIAEKSGLNRESLYKALKEDAHPRFDTVMRVLKAMGLKLVIAPCVAEKKTRYSAKRGEHSPTRRGLVKRP